MDMRHRILHYIIRFLVGDDIPGELTETIGYTADPRQFDRYNIVIIPSGFFEAGTYGTHASLPSMPLADIEGIPLLFGTPRAEWVGDTWVTHADIIASTYFLISRYEEIMRRDIRDEHGRFPGKESLPYRAGFLHRPIVDEYRALLHRWLCQTHVSLPEVKPRIRQVYLTHDVDAPTLYRSWKGLIRSIRNGRGIRPSLQSKFGPVEKDPYYTFPWMFQQDGLARKTLGTDRCHAILFMRSGGKSVYDKPHYQLRDKDMQGLIASARAQGLSIGLHSSYQAGMNPSLIEKEKNDLERCLGERVRLNRHHFLACREPEDLDRLEAVGITDDFTMGYADVAGFRLGTSHPVRWINPVTRRLSSLTLHPLTLMDCTLSEPKYMGMDYDEALAHGQLSLQQIRRYGGEAVLLWHNTSFANKEYHKKLYTHLLNDIIA